jgi:hypothetical protein
VTPSRRILQVGGAVRVKVRRSAVIWRVHLAKVARGHLAKSLRGHKVTARVAPRSEAHGGGKQPVVQQLLRPCNSRSGGPGMRNSRHVEDFLRAFGFLLEEAPSRADGRALDAVLRRLQVKCSGQFFKNSIIPVQIMRLKLKRRNQTCTLSKSIM